MLDKFYGCLCSHIEGYQFTAHVLELCHRCCLCNAVLESNVCHVSRNCGSVPLHCAIQTVKKVIVPLAGLPDYCDYKPVNHTVTVSVSPRQPLLPKQEYFRSFCTCFTSSQLTIFGHVLDSLWRVSAPLVVRDCFETVGNMSNAICGVDSKWRSTRRMWGRCDMMCMCIYNEESLYSVTLRILATCLVSGIITSN